MKFSVSSNDCYAKKEKKVVLHCQNFAHEEQKEAYILEGYSGIVALVYE